MVSLTDFFDVVKEWGWSSAIAVIFGWMIFLLIRDRLQGPTGNSKTSASDLVDKIMKATDAAADTKALRDDVDEIKTGVAKIHEAQIRLLTILETRQ